MSSNTMTGYHTHLACTACPSRAIGGFGQADAGKPHARCDNRKAPGTWKAEAEQEKDLSPIPMDDKGESK